MTLDSALVELAGCFFWFFCWVIGGGACVLAASAAWAACGAISRRRPRT